MGNGNKIWNNRHSKLWGALGVGLLGVGLLGCGTEVSEVSDASDASESELGVVVNGEAFAEAGLTSKDGWQISFEQVAVTVGDITVSGVPEGDSADPVEVPWSLEAEGEDAPPGFTQVSLQDGPVQLGAKAVPAGNYNQVQWQWGADSGTAIALKGVAVQGDRSVPFDLQFPGRFVVACGAYVGEERKGIVTADAAGEVELTLHLDHMFGDGESAPDADINTKSLGFDALAATATDQGVQVTPDSWEDWGSPELRESLEEVLVSMPHVGEGHCDVTQ